MIEFFCNLSESGPVATFLGAQSWKEMGAPEYLSTAQLDKLQDASQLRREPLDFGYIKGRIELEVMLPANSVAGIEFELG